MVNSSILYASRLCGSIHNLARIWKQMPGKYPENYLSQRYSASAASKSVTVTKNIRSKKNMCSTFVTICISIFSQNDRWFAFLVIVYLAMGSWWLMSLGAWCMITHCWYQWIKKCSTSQASRTMKLFRSNPWHTGCSNPT